MWPRHVRGLTASALSGPNRRSAPREELPTSGDHRLGSLVDGMDDLGVVDSAEVSGCDREVGVLDMRVIWRRIMLDMLSFRTSRASFLPPPFGVVSGSDRERFEFAHEVV